MKKVTSLIKHPLFSGSIILMIGSNGANFLNYLFHLVLGRMLGPSSYGELAVVVSLMGLLGVIPASLNLVVVKYISVSQSKDGTARLIHWLKEKTFIASIFSVLIIVLLSPLLSSFLNIKEVSYLILVSISFFFSLQAFLNKSILQGLLKFKEMVIGTLTENGIKLLVSIFLVYLGFQVAGVMWAFVISAIFSWYVTNYYLKSFKKQKHIIIKSTPIILFIIPVLLQSMSITSIYTLDVILVKHFFSAHDAGIYASLSNLGKIILFGAGPIGAVMFPIISQRYSKGQNYKIIFIYSFLATLAFIFPILLLYWLFPKFAINLLYGTAYLEAASLLIWFGIFIALFILSFLFISFHLSLGHTKVIIFPVVASIAQGIMIWFYHGSLFSVIMVSILITALLLGSLLIYFSHKIRTPYEKEIATKNKFAIGYSSNI